MPTLNYWDAVANAWVRLPVGPTNEIGVSTDPPDGEIMWVDTDNTSARTWVDAWEPVGPWTSAAWVTRTIPWKADVLVTWCATCYATVGGINGCALAVDGVARSHANYYFNEANTHKHVSASIVLPAMTAGPHTFGIYQEYYAQSDSNDHGHISLVAEPVY
jgi:hypothetical protein